MREVIIMNRGKGSMFSRKLIVLLLYDEIDLKLFSKVWRIPMGRKYGTQQYLFATLLHSHYKEATFLFLEIIVHTQFLLSAEFDDRQVCQ